MDFGFAIKALKQGSCVSRSGWNGKGLFVFKQIPTTIDHSLIDNLKSVPAPVRSILTNRDNNPIHYENQMVIVKPDGTIDSWVPSSSDIFAEDWDMLEIDYMQEKDILVV